MIIYIAGTDSDDTVNSLTNFVNIPFIKTSYDEIEQQFNELIKGGNEMYMKQMKEEIMKVYEKELSLVGLNLNLDVL